MQATFFRYFLDRQIDRNGNTMYKAVLVTMVIFAGVSCVAAPEQPKDDPVCFDAWVIDGDSIRDTFDFSLTELDKLSNATTWSSTDGSCTGVIQPLVGTLVTALNEPEALAKCLDLSSNFEYARAWPEWLSATPLPPENIWSCGPVYY